MNRVTSALLLLAVAGGLAVTYFWWGSESPREIATTEKPKASAATAKTNGAGVDKSARRESFGEARALLAEFSLTRDEKLLLQAQKQFPNDPKVILVSCLEAKTPDSPYLTLMEAMEPQNPLPNIMRAGMHAAAENLDGFADELEYIAKKGPLFTDERERRLDMVDVLDAKGATALSAGAISDFDRNYFEKIGYIQGVLMRNPDLINDDLTDTSSVGLELAGKFRNSKEFSLSYQMMASHIEVQMLRRMPNIPENEKASVAAYQKRVADQFTRTMKDGERIRELVFAEDSDPELRLQFYQRLSREGEAAAVDWLLKGRS
jgi:hypothetical protein